MGGFLEYLALNWDHVLELAIGHAIVVAISLAIDVVLGFDRALYRLRLCAYFLWIKQRPEGFDPRPASRTIGTSYGTRSALFLAH